MFEQVKNPTCLPESRVVLLEFKRQTNKGNMSSEAITVEVGVWILDLELLVHVECFTAPLYQLYH